MKCCYERAVAAGGRCLTQGNPMKPLTPLSRDRAETLAAQALAWLAQDPDRIGAFLGWAGTGPDALRARLRDPGLMIAVLDFLMLEDATVIAFCAEHGYDPLDVMRARGGLPGGEIVHWT